MGSKRPQAAWCSRCSVQLAVLPGARAAATATVWCPQCHGVARPGRAPGLHAVGFLRSVLGSVAGGIGSIVSSPPPPPPPTRDPYERQLASYPKVQGRKRALLVGVSYSNSKYELKGTVNDVKYMRYLLHKNFGFPEDCFLVLTEEEGEAWRRPSKENLRAAMRWLVWGCGRGDSLVFHFSGHGVQRLDGSGDEVDGYDEALCPLDFEAAGVILDDELNETLVRPLPDGTKLHALVDACHSGTVLDLPFLCRISRTGYGQWESHGLRSDKGTSGGFAILISGCDDNQSSADTTAFARETSTGAMTYSFIRALEYEPGTTYGRLLTAMRAAIRESGGGSLCTGPISSLIRRVATFRCSQEPQLSASEKFDIYHKPFLL